MSGSIGNSRMDCQVKISHNGKQQTYPLRKGLGLQTLGLRHKIPIEFDCRKSDCGICIIRITQGSGNLTPIKEAEEDFLKAMNADSNERLACQTNVMGNVSLEIKEHTFTQPQGIKLSPEAWQQALILQEENPDYQGHSLRLYIEGKGCDGFYYGVSFDKTEKDDFHFRQNGVDLIVDPKTLMFTDGSHIEWVDDERGKGFLVNNPQQKSFRGKFYKQTSWQEKLSAK